MIDAFIYLQENKILHRDIKLENILIKNDTYKIADFGWSVKNLEEKRDTFCGTLNYVSPEMISGETYNEKADNWAIGILAYELLVGYSPFNGCD